MANKLTDRERLYRSVIALLIEHLGGSVTLSESEVRRVLDGGRPHLYEGNVPPVFGRGRGPHGHRYVLAVDVDKLLPLPGGGIVSTIPVGTEEP